jgi:hypothetical protein
MKHTKIVVDRGPLQRSTYPVMVDGHYSSSIGTLDWRGHPYIGRDSTVTLLTMQVFLQSNRYIY